MSLLCSEPSSTLSPHTEPKPKPPRRPTRSYQPSALPPLLPPHPFIPPSCCSPGRGRSFHPPAAVLEEAARAAAPFGASACALPSAGMAFPQTSKRLGALLASGLLKHLPREASPDHPIKIPYPYPLYPPCPLLLLCFPPKLLSARDILHICLLSSHARM